VLAARIAWLGEQLLAHAVRLDHLSVQRCAKPLGQTALPRTWRSDEHDQQRARHRASVAFAGWRIMPRVSAFRTLWAALVGLYEETLVLLVGNLAALALNLPIGLLLFVLITLASTVLGLPLVGGGDDSSPSWLLVVIAWLMTLMPTPGNIALAGLTQVAAGPDAPTFAVFRAALRAHWRLALRCSLVSLVVLMALVGNVVFYASLGGWLRFASILWLYGTLFWLSLHIYLAPLLVHVSEPRLLNLYRRAAFIALGHPGYSMLLLLIMLAVSFLAVVFLPAYVLIGAAFISLVQAHALREIRRRHGDLVVEPDEEVYRL
jgi:hypothetical protein